jgi:hypothetical protein
MYGVFVLLFVIRAAANEEHGIREGFDARLCAAKKSIFNSKFYTLKMNRPNIKYLHTPNSNVTITNTMTFEAEVNWHLIKSLCIRNYCLTEINLDRSDIGYTRYKKYGWFKLFSETKNWAGAHSRCTDDRSNLAVPDSIRVKNVSYLSFFLMFNYLVRCYLVSLEILTFIIVLFRRILIYVLQCFDIFNILKICIFSHFYSFCIVILYIY